MSTYNILLLNVLYLSAASAQCPLNVRVPSKMRALSYSCLQIPCNYNVTDKFEITPPINGVWMIKDVRFDEFPENVIYNGSRRIYPMQFNGNLNEGNCNTLFSNLTKNYSNTYYFRIESKGFRASDICKPLQIIVKDSLRPEMNVSGEKKENSTITITCTALTPCPQSPPTLTWNLPQQPQITRDQNKDGTFTSKIQHAITLSDRHDGLTIQCRASYPVDIGDGMKLSERNLTLSVLYAPKNTTARVSPSAEVSAGTFVNLSCSSQANPPVRLFTWFWIGSEGAVNVSVGDLFSVNVTERGEYYCEARNQLGAGTSQRITLNIPEQIHWWIILGGIAGIIIFLFIGVYFWRLNSARKRSPLFHSERAEDLAATETHEVQYGEIDFSKQKVDQTTSEAGRVQLPDTVYAQVNVRK